MYMGPGFTLLAEFRVRIPDRVKQNEQNPDMVLVRHLKELLQPVDETIRVLLPQKVVQKHSHRIHAEHLSPAKFAIDGSQIKCIGLPHLQLVNGGAGDVITSHQPGPIGIPLISLLLRPGGRTGSGRVCRSREQNQEYYDGLVHRMTSDRTKPHHDITSSVNFV